MSLSNVHFYDLWPYILIWWHLDSLKLSKHNICWSPIITWGIYTAETCICNMSSDYWCLHLPFTRSTAFTWHVPVLDIQTTYGVFSNETAAYTKHYFNLLICKNMNPNIRTRRSPSRGVEHPRPVDRRSAGQFCQGFGQACRSRCSRCRVQVHARAWVEPW